MSKAYLSVICLILTTFTGCIEDLEPADIDDEATIDSNCDFIASGTYESIENEAFSDMVIYTFQAPRYDEELDKCYMRYTVAQHVDPIEVFGSSEGLPEGVSNESGFYTHHDVVTDELFIYEEQVSGSFSEFEARWCLYCEGEMGVLVDNITTWKILESGNIEVTYDNGNILKLSECNDCQTDVGKKYYSGFGECNDEHYYSDCTNLEVVNEEPDESDEVVEDSWGQLTTEIPEVYFTSDIPQSQIDTLMSAYNTSSGVWGNYGPLEFWIIGTDWDAAYELDRQYCSVRAEKDSSITSDDEQYCLDRSHNMTSYAENGGAGLGLYRSYHENYSGFVLTFASKNPYPDETDYTAVAYHEYFHVYQQAHIFTKDHDERQELSGGNPYWGEGGAEYMAQLLYSRQDGVDSNYLKDRMTWKMEAKNDLQNNESIVDIPYGPRGHIAYDLGSWYVAYIINQTSEDAYLNGFHDDLNELGWEGSFVENFGISSEQMLSDFEDFLALPIEEQLEIIPYVDEEPETISAEEFYASIIGTFLDGDEDTFYSFFEGDNITLWGGGSLAKSEIRSLDNNLCDDSSDEYCFPLGENYTEYTMDDFNQDYNILTSNFSQISDGYCAYVDPELTDEENKEECLEFSESMNWTSTFGEDDYMANIEWKHEDDGSSSKWMWDDITFMVISEVEGNWQISWWLLG